MEGRSSVDISRLRRPARVPLRVPRHLDDLARPVVPQLKGNIYLIDHHPAKHANHAEELLVVLQASRLDSTGVGELHIIRIDVQGELAVGEGGDVAPQRVDGPAKIELELARASPPRLERRL